MKNLLLVFGVISSVAVGLSGCASQPVQKTISGNPEVVINSLDKKAIKDKIIEVQISSGWNLEQETDNTLLFTRVEDPTSMKSVMTQALIGNQYSTPPQYEAKYMLASTGEYTKVIEVTTMSTQMAFGQIRRYPLNGAKVVNSYQDQLDNIKMSIEGNPMLPKEKPAKPSVAPLNPNDFTILQLNKASK